MERQILFYFHLLPAFLSLHLFVLTIVYTTSRGNKELPLSALIYSVFFLSTQLFQKDSIIVIFIVQIFLFLENFTLRN